MTDIINDAVNHLMRNSMLCVEDFVINDSNTSDAINIESTIKLISEAYNSKQKSELKKELKLEKTKVNSNHYLHESNVKIQTITSVSNFLTTMNQNHLIKGLIGEFESRKVSKRMNNSFFLDTTTDEFEFKMMRLSGNFFYRGQANSNYELLPSLYRSKIWEEKEDELYHDLIVKCPNNFQNKKRHIDILKEMQHYSLPTRLLDITQNPLVALYFAVSELENKDGELVMFYNSNKIKNASSDTVEILCALATLPNEVKKELYNAATNEQTTEEFNNNEYTKKLVHQVKLAIGSFENNIDPKDLLGIQFVKPLQDNPRIVRQNGYFIVNGLFDADKNALISKYNEKRYQVSKKAERFIVPFNKKMDLLRELSLLGINKSTIYPEIDKVSEYLKSYTAINYS